MRIIGHPRARATFLVLSFFTLMTGDVWRYTVGWLGFSIVAGLLIAASIGLLIAHRSRWSLGQLPYPLIAFLVMASLSAVWSFYPGATALGLTATWAATLCAVAVAVSYSWVEILRGLIGALKWILGLSLVFEFMVSTVLRHPLLPPVAQPGIDYSRLPDPVPPMLFWSRNELFEVFDGGKIQGIVGNSTLLSFVALIGLIVFTLGWVEKIMSRPWGVFWSIVAAVNFMFSRSATSTIGLVVVVAVVIVVVFIRIARTSRQVLTVYLSAAAITLAGVVTIVSFSTQALALLGKGPDLTNRTTIWRDVTELAHQRPVLGWGWVSHWVPWVKPFDTLAENNGVRQLHAHNAWIDVWFQLGVIGLIIFAALVFSTLARSWVLAVDRPRTSTGTPAAFTAITLLALLLLVALITQSIAESRLLVEFGFFTLVLLAMTTKNPRWGSG
ncbi:MAG: O-antigen ligase family protein [Rhodoglobus sp.]